MTENIELPVGGKHLLKYFPNFEVIKFGNRLGVFQKKYACHHNHNLVTLTVTNLKRNYTGQKIRQKYIEI